MNHDNRPLFSVIVPVYKVEKYLHQCVDSILAQTFADFEVILVDDGSPDNSDAICDEYAAKDPRVKVIHKENGGTLLARWAGYQIATGAYIVHVDSDDYIAPELLAMAEEKIRLYGAEAVLFGYSYFDACNHQSFPQPVAAGLYAGSRIETIRANLFIGADLGRPVHNNLWAVIICREKLEANAAMTPKALYRGEDLATVVPALAQCQTVYVLEGCPYYYRITPGSITNTHHGDELDQALLLAAYFLERMGETYHQKLDTYILRECANHLSFYRENWHEYRQETLKMRNYRFRAPVRTKLLGAHTGFFDCVVFLLLRLRMFHLLWLVWWIRRKKL